MASLEMTQRWQYVQKVQKQLLELIKGHAPTFDDIDHLMQQLRLAGEAVIFADFEYATKVDVDRVLWDAHVAINGRYRKLLEAYKKGDQKKHVVERRKLEKRYADFLKTSQYFYKGYIQRIASHFDGLHTLRRIAHRLSLSILTVDKRVKVSEDVMRMIDISGRNTLLHLGDLSRYRNNLRTKDRSWEAALAHYALANDLDPDSGSAHNQMAVIALADGNHLDAVYHIYRALAVKEPHVIARNNLELEFKKIISAWRKQPRPKTDSLGTLVYWFVILHAKFYEGVEFSTHDELENEVLSRLALLLKEQSFGETLEKLVLINIAAEAFAGQRITESGSNPKSELVQSFYFLLRFNVRMLFVLLQVLQPELEDAPVGEDLPDDTDRSRVSATKEKITSTSRRVLPALRQYSIWLVTQAQFLVSNVGSGPLNVHIKEMWKMYADVLTRIANFFPTADLTHVNYLLEEDETTVGFKPFRSPEIPHECDIYTDEERKLKPRITDPGVERNHPNVEMQARVLEILLVGLKLQLRDDIPIALGSGAGSPIFSFVEEGLPLASPMQIQSTAPDYSTPNPASGPFAAPEAALLYEEVDPAESVAASDSHSMDTNMRLMVDNLLDPASTIPTSSKESSYGMHSHTANEIFAPLGTNGVQIVRQSTPKMLPSLPGIWNSPFTPQPNELQVTSPDRPHTARQFSPLGYATNQQRQAAVEQLEQITGFGSKTSISWGQRNPTNQLGVNQFLQESLNQQFGLPMTMSSSSFTDSSSIYANTPQYHRPAAVRKVIDGNNSTYYPGATEFDKNAMLQSSLWNGSQPAGTWNGYGQSPPGGQGE